MIKHRLALLMIFLAIGFGDRAYSQDPEIVENQTNSALSAFYGFCLTEMFDLERVTQLADRFGWEKIEQNELEVFIPQIEAEIERYIGYLALAPDNPPLPIAVFVGESNDPGGRTEHCSIFFKDVQPTEFIQAFVADTDAAMVHKESRVAGDAVFYEVPEFPGDLVLLESQARSRGLRATFLIREPGE